MNRIGDDIIWADCSECGVKTRWDYTLGKLPLCIKCHEKQIEAEFRNIEKLSYIESYKVMNREVIRVNQARWYFLNSEIINKKRRELYKLKAVQNAE